MANQLIVPFIVFMLIATITPGPNNLMLIAAGANFGFRRTVPHIMGILIGVFLLTSGIAMGLGLLFNQVSWIRLTIQWIGAGYLLYLSWKISQMHHPIDNQSLHKGKRPISFFQAMLLQFVNAKSWIVIVSVFSLFAKDASDIKQANLLIIATIVICTAISTVAWASLGAYIQQFLKKPRLAVYFNYTLALLTATTVIFVIT